MKKLRKLFAVFLALAMVLPALPALAADAYGEQLQVLDTVLNEGTSLYQEIYWTGSDMRRETYFTYSPNDAVSPKIAFNGSVTARGTGSSAAAQLEKEGYRVVAGVNGDFFDSNGVPTGILVSGGRLYSSCGTNYAIGFKSDGSAVIGMPYLSIRGSLNGQGNFYIAAVNKARSSYGGIYVYTYNFKSAHNTGTTDAGVDVILQPVADADTGETPPAEPVIGGTCYYEVLEVRETTGGSTDIEPGQLVLSVNGKADVSELNYLRSMKAGDIFGLTVTAQDEAWNDVTEAIGGLYPLVKNGEVQTANLDGTNAPRTAVGITADGDVILYTVDGRQSGYSVGASQKTLAKRMAELGCVDAICLDGGGSTTAVTTMPDSTDYTRLNSPSDGGERQVTDHLFLVATQEATDRAGSVYLSADNRYVLAGSTVEITAALLDTNYIPMGDDVTLTASDGSIRGTVFTAPDEAGTVTITGKAGGRTGELELQVIDTPDAVQIYSGDTAVTSLTLNAGAKAELSASATYKHLPIASDTATYDWTVSGGVGTVDEKGVFTASQLPGTGTLTVTKGSLTATIPVTVVGRGPSLLEDFEDGSSGYTGFNVTTAGHTGDKVRMGRTSLQVAYTLGDSGAGLQLGLTVSEGYDRLNLWVYGDGSGNVLSLYDNTGATTALTTLDFTGWKQVSVKLPAGCTTLAALTITAGTAEAPVTSGTIYLDQLVASNGDVIDNTVPEITGQLSGSSLTATVTDAADGFLKAEQITLTCDRKALSFSLDPATGVLSADLSAAYADGKAHRVTLTARDVSGNMASLSWDIGTAAASPFTDLTLSSGSAHWASGPMNYFYQEGILTGFEENGGYTAKPDKQMTRAEFAVMLFRWLGLDAADYASAQVPFSDLDTIDEWALDAAKAMYVLGVMQGTGHADGTVTFDAKSTITRAQAITMLGRLQERGYATTDISTFPDSGDVPDWARPYMETMYAQGILSGSDGRLNPNGPMTRGQACKVLYFMG